MTPTAQPRKPLSPALVAALFTSPLGVALPRPTFRRVLARPDSPLDAADEQHLTEGQKIMRFQRRQKARR